MAAPSVVIIEELNGAKRELQLRGGALPFMGAAWESEQGLVTTWYQGNGIEATQNVLGPRELPSEWEGEWNTTRMVSTPVVLVQDGEQNRITRASSLRDVLDDMFFLASLLRVTWAADTDRKIVRVGRATRWKFEHTRADDIAWRIEWAWKGRGGVQQRVVSLKKENQEATRAALNLELSNLADDLWGSNYTKKPAQNFTLGDLEALAKAPGEYIEQLQQTVNSVTNAVGKVASIIATVAATPAQIGNQIVDTAENTRAILARAEDELGRQVPDAYASLGSDYFRVTPVLKAHKFMSGAQQRISKSHAQALSLAIRARKIESPLNRNVRTRDESSAQDLLGVVIAKAGETFLTLSDRWYKTPDRAADLAKANGYPAYQVSPPPGSVIIVPVLKNTVNLQKA